jgi:hypothetical protein
VRPTAASFADRSGAEALASFVSRQVRGSLRDSGALLRVRSVSTVCRRSVLVSLAALSTAGDAGLVSTLRTLSLREDTAGVSAERAGVFTVSVGAVRGTVTVLLLSAGL